MARMYSRKRGKSGSKKPLKKKAPWVTHKPAEIEELVVKMAKQGNQAAAIGITLRDQYGIPTTRINGTKISAILIKHGLSPKIPDDVFNLMKKAVGLHAHLEKNSKDHTSKRGLEITESKIRRLAKFHTRNRILPPGWKYNLEQAKLLVK